MAAGWFRRRGDRSGALHYWDGSRWTGAVLPGDPRRPSRVTGKVLLACLAAIAVTIGFVTVVLTLKGGVAAILLIGFALWGWLALRRRRAARGPR